VVVVSHEPERIREFSQRELVMEDGRLIAAGDYSRTL
jgi:energy-coupling factor transporter ATP-binding protein EcfA2